MDSEKFELPDGSYVATLTSVYALSGLVQEGSVDKTDLLTNNRFGRVIVGHLADQIKGDILLSNAAIKAFAGQVFGGKKSHSPADVITAYLGVNNFEIPANGELLLTVQSSQPIERPKHVLDLTHCVLCIENQQLEELEVTVDRLRKLAMTALCLSGQQDVTPGGKRLAHYVRITGGNAQVPIFRSQITGGRVSSTYQTPLVESHYEEARKLLKTLVKIPRSIAHTPKLLIDSHETEEDSNYRSFIEAWVGLEVFIKGVEKQYWREMEGLISKDSPSYQHEALYRLMKISSKRLSLADKFLVVATVLAPDEAPDDCREYQEIKAARDGYFHSLSGDPDDLPTMRTQRLLRKYLKMHLSK